jgi:hypothetical protein
MFTGEDLSSRPPALIQASFRQIFNSFADCDAIRIPFYRNEWLMLAVEKLEGRWIRRTPYGVDGNIDFDQTTIHAEHFDGGCSHIRTQR